MKTAFQHRDGALHYLEKIRGGIPFGPVQMQLILELLQCFAPQPQRAVDLGCGDGTLAEFLLNLYPEIQVTCVDHSQAMLEFAQKRLEPFGGQVKLVAADFSTDMPAFLAEQGSCDIILSGYAIHHLPNGEKRRLYEAVYSMLNPGGVFLNMEHVASASEETEWLHDKLFVDFLTQHRGVDRDTVKREYDTRPDKADNRLERVEIQVGWLQEIGFRHADCFFKWMELAVFGGVK